MTLSSAPESKYGLSPMKCKVDMIINIIAKFTARIIVEAIHTTFMTLERKMWLLCTKTPDLKIE